MTFYVSKKAGSVMFRAPKKHHILAGDRVPDEVVAAVSEANLQILVKEGALVESREAAEAEADPGQEELPSVGVGQHEFSPEAHVQRGERVDAKLEALKREQEDAERRAREEAEVDEDAGGSADGVVKVRMPDEEDEDDDGLTEEERRAIEEMEAEED